jgi:hypothetical protein
VFFAYFWLNETLTRIDLMGTGFVIAGAILSVAFGNHDDKSYTQKEINNLWASWAVFGYFLVVVVLCSYCYWCDWWWQRWR